MKNNFGLAICAASLLIGCTATITAEMLPLAESLEPKTAVEMEEFRQARSSFISQCSGCHFHMYPSEYTPRQWQQTRREHIGSTHLDKAEYQKVFDYILRASELHHNK